MAGEQRRTERNAARGKAARGSKDAGQKPGAMSAYEREEIDQLSSPRAPVIYQIVRRHGEEEIHRPATSLWWSGVAAGLSISFSLLAQAVLISFLPDVPWRPAVASLGYSVGFLMVVLGRQQLFTENTVTVVLPVMAEFTWFNLRRLGRMWSIVFLANMTGAMCAAVFMVVAPVITPDLRDIMIEVGHKEMSYGWIEMFLRAVAAGFLIATMVWMLPSAQAAQFHIVTMITYLIAAAGFVHIVAGSVVAFILVLTGETGVQAMVVGFMLPTLLGNIIGGTALFALLSYAQIMKEI